MATRPISELNQLSDLELITREEVGVLAGSTRPEGEKHLTVNMWLHRYGPLGGSEPTFPQTVPGEDGFTAMHRVGDVRDWLSATGRVEYAEAREAYYTKVEVCDLLEIRPATLKAWAFKGLIPYADARQGRYARWKKSTIDNWVEQINLWVELTEQALAS